MPANQRFERLAAAALRLADEPQVVGVARRALGERTVFGHATPSYRHGEGGTVTTPVCQTKGSQAALSWVTWTDSTRFNGSPKADFVCPWAAFRPSNAI